MQITCCKCGKGYKFKPLISGENIYITCPHCDYKHLVDFIPFDKEIEGTPLESIDLKTYWAIIGGSRILSITAGTDHSGSDDTNVTGWTKTDELIMAVCIQSDGKDTGASTYKLQWQDDTDGGGYVDLASDGASPEMSYTIGDASWNHGDAVAVADQVCDIVGGDTRQDGERVKNTSASDSIDLADEYQSELWFGIDSTNAEDGHVYSFQLYSIGEDAAIGVCGATLAIAAGLRQQATGGYALGIAGTLAAKLIASKAVGGYALTIAGVLSSVKIATKAVGGYALSIAGTLSSKATKLVGGYALGITGALSKKVSRILGGYALGITGTLSQTKKSFVAVGGYALTIAGTLSSFKKSFADTGGYALAIAGALVKKTTSAVGEYAIAIAGVANGVKGGGVNLQNVGGYSITIAGNLIKKTTSAVGEYALTISGAIIKKVTSVVGEYALAISGNLVKKAASIVGGYALAISGGVIKKTTSAVGEYAVGILGGIVKKATSAVGGWATSIAGVANGVKLGGATPQSVGGYALAIVGALSKKTTSSVGEYALSITGSTIKKIYSVVGEWATVITGGATGVKLGAISYQNTGGYAIAIAGTVSSVLTAYVPLPKTVNPSAVIHGGKGANINLDCSTSNKMVAKRFKKAIMLQFRN